MLKWASGSQENCHEPLRMDRFTTWHVSEDECSCVSHCCIPRCVMITHVAYTSVHNPMLQSVLTCMQTSFVYDNAYTRVGHWSSENARGCSLQSWNLRNTKNNEYLVLTRTVVLQVKDAREAAALTSLGALIRQCWEQVKERQSWGGWGGHETMHIHVHSRAHISTRFDTRTCAHTHKHTWTHTQKLTSLWSNRSQRNAYAQPTHTTL